MNAVGKVKQAEKAARYDRLILEHNKMCYDVYARLGMLMTNMSAVRGTPRPTSVALWRDELKSIQADLVSVKSTKA